MRTTTIEVGPGAIVRIGDDVLCVKRWELSTSLVARNVMTMTDRIVTLAEITESMAQQQTGEQLDLNSVDEDDWDEAVEKFGVLRQLVNANNRTGAQVQKAAEVLCVSQMTAYRWLKRIEQTGTVTCLLRKQRKDKGSLRLELPVEEIIRSVIATEYLTKHRKSPKTALTEIQRLCRLKNLKAPGKATLQRRLEMILPEERERKRNGRNAALDFRASRGSLPGQDCVHAIWQIDHTKVDIILVDEVDRIPVGRPWITVAIDVFSRMIVGWYVSFDPPGTLGTGVCIANAILPKDALLANLGVSYPWPCQGKPRVIHADNAKEFRGETLKNACQEHGFDMKFRKVKRPNYGGHIERMLGTLLSEIHALDGTTFSNPQERGEYDSEAEATMTLNDFERWLANLILGVYHQRIHSELECPPIKKYHDGILGDDDTPGIGLLAIAADPEKLRIDFLPFELRTIQPDGVLLDCIQYHSSVLDKWIGSLDTKTKRLTRKFIFRRDPRNISFLYFWDPDVRQYFQIPYRDIRRPAISLWELRQVKAYLSERGKTDVNESMIFSALDEMKRIEEESKNLTRRQRMDQERRRRHKSQVPTPPRSPSETVPDVIAEAPAKEHKSRLFDLSEIEPFQEIESL